MKKNILFECLNEEEKFIKKKHTTISKKTRQRKLQKLFGHQKYQKYEEREINNKWYIKRLVAPNLWNIKEYTQDQYDYYKHFNPTKIKWKH